MTPFMKNYLPNNKHVLFIASYAKCPRVWKMASTLANNGLKVTILEWDRDSILPTIDYAENIYIRRMRLIAPYGLKLIFKLPIWQLYVFLFILTNHFTIVQPQNLDNLLPAWLACHIKRIKVVYDIADFYADAFVPRNMALLRKIVAWLEKTLVKYVDALILVDEVRVKQVGSQAWIIYNSPPDIYNKLKTNNYMNSSSDSKFTIFYAGILVKDRGLDILIRAIQDLDDVKLVIAGFGEIEKKFSSILRGKHNVQFIGRVPYDTVLRLTLSSDCVIALYDPQVPNNIYASPNKLFEAMMCAKPIIVSDGTAMASIVRKEKCGLVVKYNNYKDVQEAIIRLKNNPLLRKELGGNGRQAYEQKYSWDLMKIRLLRLYDQLCL